ncbi:hypothetical protein H0H81_002834 [Sphagnurus paluster]|uniref:Uncharacterized protein n=1 Tax=Sphagnurus paluster TaxID=117069 RepID=A0A9P7K4G2_9AGAR|nr:hypothetical protein H0H81_002834 [Sphagnurus paluster]
MTQPPNIFDTLSSNLNTYHHFPNSTVFGIMNWFWTGSPLKSLLETTKLLYFLKSDKFVKEDLAAFDIRKQTAQFDQQLEGNNGASDLSTPQNDGWIESDVDKASEPERIYDEIFSSDAMIEAHLELQRQPPEPGCELEQVVAALMFWSDLTHLASFGNTSLWPAYTWFGNMSKWYRGKPTLGTCKHLAYIPNLPDSFEDEYYDQTGKPLTPELLTHCQRELFHAVWKCILDGTFMHAYKHGIVIECPDGVSRRFFPRIFTYSADYPEKVLISTIRNFGRCPCSRCTICKEKIPDLGTKYDGRRRETQARRDTSRCRFNIRVAREFIYEHGYGVKSAAVERLLEVDSSVPTNNAFSILSEFSFNFFAMLAPDVMHKFEIGVWKAVLMHLIRILIAAGQNSAPAMNRRYRQVPTFGHSTIRRFSDNVASLKKLAARNYEDLLQCAIPVFDGLLNGDDNNTVVSLLFTLAEWHALGKLRLHTETSLLWLDQCTSNLGSQLRKFKSDMCSRYDTRELPKEAQACIRREARNTVTPASVEENASADTQGHGRGHGQGRSRGSKSRGWGSSTLTTANIITSTAAAPPSNNPPSAIQPPSTPRNLPGGPLTAQKPQPKAGKKLFNLHLIKLHALGDYVEFIRWFGTTDSYSTQPGELEHRLVKQFYVRTNKNRAVVQISRLERRNQALICQARVAAKEKAKQNPASSQSSRRRRNKISLTVQFHESEPLPPTPPEYHHHISPSRNFPIHLQAFILGNEGAPAVTNFYTKLQDHLLGRLLHPDWSGGPNEFSEKERTKIHIVNDQFYRHKVMRVNYTGYDIRRGQDSINSRNHADIMTLAPEGETHDNGDHPFWYGRVIGIFHVDFIHDIPGTRQIPISKQVLWMRWFQYDKSYRAGFQRRRLHRIHFIPSHDPSAFGFLDPDEVVRGSHLIPAFHHGPTDEYLKGTSVTCEEDELNDWKFVDRDMYMRYAGSGVGHYQVPLTDTPVADSTSTSASQPLDKTRETPADTNNDTLEAPITIELLRNLAEAAGLRIVGGDDHDADEEHRDKLTLDEEDEGEAHIEGTVEIDKHDIGAEDGEDGAEEFDDRQDTRTCNIYVV